MYYIKLWGAYMDKSLKQWAEYKTDFLFITLASIVTIALGVVNIDIIFSQTETIMGWSQYEVL